MPRLAPSDIGVSVLLVASLLSACSLLSEKNQNSIDPGGLLKTSNAQYEAQLKTDGRRRVVFDVPYKTRNSTADTLYLIGCNFPPPPTLEKQVNGTWGTAFSQSTPLCLSPPWKIAPGEVRHDTLNVVGYLPNQNIEPTFDTTIEGTYRLNRTIYARLGTDRAGEDLLPRAARISNTFEVER